MPPGRKRVHWMFSVYHKDSGKVYTVYAVNGLLLIVWDAEARHWSWLPISECEPVEVV